MTCAICRNVRDQLKPLACVQLPSWLRKIGEGRLSQPVCKRFPLETTVHLTQNGTIKLSAATPLTLSSLFLSIKYSLPRIEARESTQNPRVNDSSVSGAGSICQRTGHFLPGQIFLVQSRSNTLPLFVFAMRLTYVFVFLIDGDVDS